MVELPLEKCAVGMVVDCTLVDRHAVHLLEAGHVLRIHDFPRLKINHIQVVPIRSEPIATYLSLNQLHRDAIEAKLFRLFAPNHGHAHPLLDLLMQMKREELARQVLEAGRIPWVVLE